MLYPSLGMNNHVNLPLGSRLYLLLFQLDAEDFEIPEV
jgi:hypothetical protein